MLPTPFSICDICWAQLGDPEITAVEKATHLIQQIKILETFHTQVLLRTVIWKVTQSTSSISMFRQQKYNVKTSKDTAAEHLQNAMQLKQSHIRSLWTLVSLKAKYLCKLIQGQKYTTTNDSFSFLSSCRHTQDCKSHYFLSDLPTGMSD